MEVNGEDAVFIEMGQTLITMPVQPFIRACSGKQSVDNIRITAKQSELVAQVKTESIINKIECSPEASNKRNSYTMMKHLTKIKLANECRGFPCSCTSLFTS